MDTESDKIAFSKRLNLALESLPNHPLTSAQIAIQFNLRYKKEPISPQAVHKWLTAQAFPTPDKIKTLSEWLGVSYDWLRYGVKVDQSDFVMDDMDKLMLEHFQRLNPAQRKTLLNLVVEMYKSQP